MKKVSLFAAAMIVCVGMAFAQTPVKKSNEKKVNTESKEVVNQDKAPAAVAAPAQKQHCGNCPHHAKANAAVTSKPECKKTENEGCKKEGNKCCKKDGNNACTKDEKNAALKK